MVSGNFRQLFEMFIVSNRNCQQMFMLKAAGQKLSKTNERFVYRLNVNYVFNDITNGLNEKRPPSEYTTI